MLHTRTLHTFQTFRWFKTWARFKRILSTAAKEGCPMYEVYLFRHLTFTACAIKCDLLREILLREEGIFRRPKSVMQKAAVAITSPLQICASQHAREYLMLSVYITPSHAFCQLPMTTTTRPAIAAPSSNGSDQALNSLACKEGGL